MREVLKTVVMWLMAGLFIALLVILFFIWRDSIPSCSRAGSNQTAGDVVDCMATRTAEAHNR